MFRPESHREGRPRDRRLRPARHLESLEGRQMMAANAASLLGADAAVVARAHPIGNASLRQLSFLDNDGRILTGTDREGDTWTLTLHGPGTMIVTDTSPNDGFLNDELATIQLIGTDINNSHLTGTVSASPRILTDGTIGFNRLIAESGVNSIVLNGFELRETGPDPGIPGISLLGGVRTLGFQSLIYEADQPEDGPAVIRIGDPSTPLTVKPSIYITHIFNNSFDGSTVLNDQVPRTDPSVQILVNGEIQDLEMVSVTALPTDAATNARVSPVAYTGRTAVQTFGINGLKVAGSARNFTVSRTAQPFASRFSGVDRIGHAFFGGNADAVALDVSNGEIGRLKFLRGLGNSYGSQDTSMLESGTPLGLRGYPASGLSGGVVAARNIRRQEYGADRLILQHRQSPNEIQLRTSTYTDYVPRAGNALTNATVATAGSQGDTNIVGNSWRTLVAAGFDYQSYVQGLDPTRSPSHIRTLRQRGDLVDSIVASSYRSTNGIYGDGDDAAGNGLIEGNLDGNVYQTNPTGQGSGFYARRVIGRLPSVGGPQYEGPKRFRNVLYRV
jgi:hypothetical protein